MINKTPFFRQKTLKGVFLFGIGYNLDMGNASPHERETEGTDSTIKKLSLCALFSLAFPLIILLVYTVDPGYHPYPFPISTAMAISVPAFILAFLSYFLLFFARNPKTLRICFPLAFAWMTAFSLYLGIAYHPDFLKILFMILEGGFVVVIYRVEILWPVKDRKKALKFLSDSAIIGAGAYFLWIILLAYAAIVRMHPEKVKFICMNVYGTVMVAVLVFTIKRARDFDYRIVQISKNKIILDQYDFTEFFGDVDFEVISFFLSHDHKATCGDIVSSVANADRSRKASGTKNPQCDSCTRETNKASMCPAYKNIYNRVHNLKKLLESMKIGTILTPENKFNIRDEGWRLFFFDDVKLKVDL
jgi:hypothetical protein